MPHPRPRTASPPRRASLAALPALALLACEPHSTVPLGVPATVSILAPAAGAELLAGRPVALRGEAAASGLAPFPAESLRWRVDGVSVGAGGEVQVVLEEGSHRIVLEARAGRRSAADSIDVHARAAPPVGSVLWHVPLRGLPAAGLAQGASGVLYTTAAGPSEGNGVVAAVSREGELRWAVETGRSLLQGMAPVATPEGNVLVGHAEGLLALWLDGRKRWDYGPGEADPPGHVHSGPAVRARNGTLYVALEDGSVLALTPQGTRLWRTPVRTTGGEGALLFGPPTLVGDSQLILLSRQHEVHSLRARTGEQVWSLRLNQRPLAPTASLQVSVAETPEGGLFIPLVDSLHVTDPDGTRRSAGVLPDRADGVSPLSSTAPVLDRRHVYLPNSAGGVEVFEASTGIWLRRHGPPGDRLQGVAGVGAGGVTYVLGEDTLYSYAADGARRFVVGVPHGLYAHGAQGGPVVDADGTVFVRGRDGITAVYDTVGPPDAAPWPTYRGSLGRLGRGLGPSLPTVRAPADGPPRR